MVSRNRRICILDVNFSDKKLEGGAAKTSINIVFGLTQFFEVIYIPKFVLLKLIEKKGNVSEILSFIGYLREKGVKIPESIEHYIKNTNVYNLSDYINVVSDIVKTVDYILDMNFIPNLNDRTWKEIFGSLLYKGEIYALSRVKGPKKIALLQTLDNRDIDTHIKVPIFLFFRFGFFDLQTFLRAVYRSFKYMIARNILLKHFDMILVFSEASIKSLKATSSNKFIVLKYGNTTKVAVPSGMNKKNYILYFARLVPDKGVVEVPFIINILKRTNSDVKLVMAGMFGNTKIKNWFFDRISKLGIEKNVEYKGFVSENDLKILIGEAKVVLYPSHYDSFPFVILECLSEGTAVVAYDIPTIRDIYGKIPIVSLVPEFDIEAMASELLKFLSMSSEEYRKIIDNEITKQFVKDHSNNNLAVEEIAKIITEQ